MRPSRLQRLFWAGTIATLLTLSWYARPLAQQATLLFGSFNGLPKAVSATSGGNLNVTIAGGTVGATSGGTGQSTVTTGDLLYGSATNTWSKLADVAIGSVLVSGGIGTAPAWSTDPTVTTATSSRTSLVTTSTDGLVSTNTTAAVVGTQVQISPRNRMRGNGWDIDDVVSRTVDFFTEALPVAGNTVTASWKLGYSLAGAAASYPLIVDSAGNITNLGYILTGSNIYIPAGSAFFFNGRSQMVSGADGTITMANNAGNDFTYLRMGASGGDIVLSFVAPTISSGFSTGGSPATTIAGRATAFALTIGNTVSATGTVSWGVTWTNIPTVNCTNTITANIVQTVPTTTAVVLNGVWVEGDIIRCSAIGY